MDRGDKYRLRIEASHESYCENCSFVIESAAKWTELHVRKCDVKVVVVSNTVSFLI